MKPLTYMLLPLLYSLTLTAQTQGLKYVPLQENGTTTAYVSVPERFNCNVNIPDTPTALCAAGGYIYHLHGAFISNPVDPEQYFNNLLQQVSAENPNANIENRYRISSISQYVTQRDANLLFRYGQQVVTFGFDVVDKQDNQKSSAAVTVSSLPNNGAPVTIVQLYGVTVPLSESHDYSQIQNELVRFAQSYQYDQNWLQAANAQHLQFQGNLSAKNRAFQQSQQQIHQSNMDALDRSHNSYMERSAASDRSQSAYIDSIHERQQLVDPTTGTRYEADGYYDYNYVNPNDSSIYYRTNDPTANPNINNNQGEDYQLLQENNAGW
ncbi:MAG: hypothetical protein B6D73_19935 [gamma proteobacterium symbiont of Stewartia floridana]|nr:MAG: hypothetical protein B6D73_19935 [gamma proteobacterium symbiont of Stewartia floridana]